MGFGLLAICLSFAIVCAYFIFVQPKQAMLMKKYDEIERGFSKAQNDKMENGIEEGKNLMLLPYQLGMGLAVVAAAVGFLALETLVTLALIIVNRRVALAQINQNLAQISAQLQQWKNPPAP